MYMFEGMIAMIWLSCYVLRFSLWVFSLHDLGSLC
jgi:hypothetical protein